MLKINSPNLFGWLQETLRKEQKLFGSSSFYLESKLSQKKNKEHYVKKKKIQNVLYVILGALVGRAHPKIW